MSSQPVRLRAPLLAARFAIWAIGGLLAAVLVGLAICLVPLGVGLWIFPRSVGWLRAIAGRTRRLVAEVTGQRFDEHYDVSTVPAASTRGRVRQCLALLRDGLLWRDLRWALLDSTIGVLIALLPLGLVLYGVFGLLVQPFVWQAIDRAGGSNWYTAVKVDSAAAATTAAAIGAALIVAGFLTARAVQLRSARLSAALLAQPTRARLRRRVIQLTDTRAKALDLQVAQLRRIERELHDGAQARLVAMGMTLGSAEQLLDSDPAAVRVLLSDARRASSEALSELRDLVRGIHPPVLADRGLVDAVRTLALDSTADVEVDSQLPGQVEPAVESAAYFAISELLTNAVTHAHATRVAVSIDYVAGALRANVTDDGLGGAELARGTGLQGISARLSTFDGTLSITSPRGGPTCVGLQIPCELFHPVS